MCVCVGVVVEDAGLRAAMIPHGLAKILSLCQWNVKASSSWELRDPSPNELTKYILGEFFFFVNEL